MGLSEARGLVLFRVVRGGIGVTQRLGATGTVSSTGHCHTHPRTRASQEPIGHHQRRSPEMEGLFTRDAQAACDFSFSASKFSPFFQSIFFGGFFGNAEHADYFRGFAYLPWLLYLLTLPRNGAAVWARTALLPFLFWALAAGAYPAQTVSFGIIALSYLSVEVISHRHIV